MKSLGVLDGGFLICDTLRTEPWVGRPLGKVLGQEVGLRLPEPRGGWCGDCYRGGAIQGGVESEEGAMSCCLVCGRLLAGPAVLFIEIDEGLCEECSKGEEDEPGEAA